MTFTLLPAVDVADGRAVRLVQGQTDSDTAGTDALEAALEWQRAGAEWVHLVDLDAAFGHGSNAQLLESIIAQLEVNVELAGGIRDQVSLDRALSTDCDRVVLATTAVDDLAWCDRAIAEHGERIAVGLDVLIAQELGGPAKHRLQARGQPDDRGDLWQILEHLDEAGCARYVVTDVSKDGMLSGPNMELYRAVATATDAPIIASGGVGTIADLVALAGADQAGFNIEGSIVGKALYAARFTLADALSAVHQLEESEHA